MNKLLLIVSILTAVIVICFAPRGRAEAAGICTASAPQISGVLHPNGDILIVRTAPSVYITAVCATVNGTTSQLIQGGVLTQADSAGCYNFYKSQHYAFIGRGAHWSASCPTVTLTLRTAKATA